MLYCRVFRSSYVSVLAAAMDYQPFFAEATRLPAPSTRLLAPFSYQSRLAEQVWPDLLNVPTGMVRLRQSPSHGYGSVVGVRAVAVKTPMPRHHVDWFGACPCAFWLSKLRRTFAGG